jgi:DNA polymerase-3 subunit beta
MDLRLSRSEFLTELLPMQGVVERKATIPVLSHLLLQTDGSKLRLKATDLDVSLTSWCNAQVAHGGAIAVQARKFSEIIRALVEEEVQLVQNEPEWLEIRSGSSRFKIHGMRPDDFPQLPEVDDRLRVELPFAELRRMIGKVLFAVSAEESRFQLGGALLKLKVDTIEMVATDGYRLALVESPAGGGGVEDAVLVARKALQELQRFEEDGTLSFRRGEHHLSFSIGRRELICRILEGTFPDYERVIAHDHDKHVLFDRRLLDAAIQRVSLLTGDRARAVRFSFAPGELVISTANPDLGEATEQLPCDYEGPAIKLGLNPDFVRDFLAVAESTQVRLELKDENSQCLCFPQEAEDGGESAGRYLCVIMPMRV